MRIIHSQEQLKISASVTSNVQWTDVTLLANAELYLCFTGYTIVHWGCSVIVNISEWQQNWRTLLFRGCWCLRNHLIEVRINNRKLIFVGEWPHTVDHEEPFGQLTNQAGFMTRRENTSGQVTMFSRCWYSGLEFRAPGDHKVIGEPRGTLHGGGFIGEPDSSA